MLVEGSCGKVIHDLKLSGGSLTSVYWLTWKPMGEELRVLWLGQVQALSASSHVGLHPRWTLAQEGVRRRHNPPWLGRFGFEGDLRSP